MSGYAAPDKVKDVHGQRAIPHTNFVDDEIFIREVFEEIFLYQAFEEWPAHTKATHKNQSRD